MESRLELANIYNNNFQNIENDRRIQLFGTFESFYNLLLGLGMQQHTISYFPHYVNYITKVHHLNTDEHCLYFQQWYNDIIPLMNNIQENMNINPIIPQHTTPSTNSLTTLELELASILEQPMVNATTSVVEDSTTTSCSEKEDENKPKPKAEVTPQRKKPGRPRKNNTNSGKDMNALKRVSVMNATASKKFKKNNNDWNNNVEMCLLTDDHRILEHETIFCERNTINVNKPHVFERLKYLNMKTLTAHQKLRDAEEEFNFMKDILHDYIDTYNMRS